VNKTIPTPLNTFLNIKASFKTEENALRATENGMSFNGVGFNLILKIQK